LFGCGCRLRLCGEGHEEPRCDGNLESPARAQWEPPKSEWYGTEPSIAAQVEPSSIFGDGLIEIARPAGPRCSASPGALYLAFGVVRALLKPGAEAKMAKMFAAEAFRVDG